MPLCPHCRNPVRHLTVPGPDPRTRVVDPIPEPRLRVIGRDRAEPVDIYHDHTCRPGGPTAA